jgi:tetratricopeptide (TPR) repeat protein
LALVGDAAQINHGLAMVRLSLGEPDAALQHCAQEIEDSRRMRELAPDKGWVHAQLGWSLHLQGMILWQVGRSDEAEASFREAVRVLEDARQQDGSHRGIRFRLAEVQNLHAILLARSDRDAAAEPLFERAVALLRELASEHPGVRSYHGNLGNALCNLGVLRVKQQRHPESILLYDEALPHLRRAMVIDPRAGDVRDFRRALGLEAATAALELGDHGRAAADARAWMHDLPQGAHWPCGRLLALCAKIVADDALLAAGERVRLRDEYAAQAIGWLTAAVQQGKVRTGMLEHHAFDALRERPDFQALLASVSK